MAKPKTIAGYDADYTDACERVLVTLLRGMGPWKDSVYLVGGLTPRYLVQDRPPVVPAHAGTTDVDVVIDLKILVDTEAYRTLEENLHRIGFERSTNEKNQKVSWRWQTRTEDGQLMILELLADDPTGLGARVGKLPTEGGVSAVHIPHSSIVFDMYEERVVQAALLHDDGVAQETIRHADLVSFTCLKAFALNQRNEGKDAHDLVYCLQYAKPELSDVAKLFCEQLNGKHATVVTAALDILRIRFASDGVVEGHRKDGPVAVGKFELGDNLETRESRILIQRNASSLIERLLETIYVGNMGAWGCALR